MRIMLIAAALLVSACAQTQTPAPDPAAVSVGAELEAMAADGREIATAQCAACHSVGEYGESPNPQAPVFRAIFQRYDPAVLEDELIAGIRVSHPMPDFQLNPQGVDELIVYLRSIQEPPPATH